MATAVKHVQLSLCCIKTAPREKRWSLLTLFLAPSSTIYTILRNFTDRGSFHPKKALGESTKRQDCLLKRIQLQDWLTGSAELSHGRKQADVSASACPVRLRILEPGLPSLWTAKKPLLSKKNERLICVPQEIPRLDHRKLGEFDFLWQDVIHIVWVI